MSDLNIVKCLKCGRYGTGSEFSAATGGDDYIGQCPECYIEEVSYEERFQDIETEDQCIAELNTLRAELASVKEENERLAAELAREKQTREKAEAVSRMMAAQMIEFQEYGHIVLETGEGENEHTINTVEELIEDYEKKGEQDV